MVCKTIDELFQKGGDAVNPPALKGLVQKVRYMTLMLDYSSVLYNIKFWDIWCLIVALLFLRFWYQLLIHIQTGFSMEDVLRKYIRYALNEKPFNPDLVVNLIQLRKASMLDDSQVAEILNEISRRIVREKGNFGIAQLLVHTIVFILCGNYLLISYWSIKHTIFHFCFILDEDALDEQPPMQALFVFDPVHNICCFLHMKWCKSWVICVPIVSN